MMAKPKSLPLETFHAMGYHMEVARAVGVTEVQRCTVSSTGISVEIAR